MQKINFKNLPDTSTPLNASTLNQMQDNIESAINSIANLICPIGKVEVFFDNQDHSNYLGFTWERTSIGRVPVGIDENDEDFDTIGETGGSKELQEHTHNNRMDTLNNLDQNYGLSSNGVYADRVVVRSNNSNSNTLYNEKNIQDAGTGNSGNLQPYEVMAFWKRVS